MTKAITKSSSQHWLEIVCHQLPGVDSAVFMLPEQKGKQFKPLAKWPAKLNQFNEFVSVVEYVLKKGEQAYFPESVKNESQIYDLFAFPLRLDSAIAGILVVKIDHQYAQHKEAIFTSLQQSIKWLTLAKPGQNQAGDFYQRVVGLLATSFEQEDYRQALVAMVTELTHAFECDRVAYAEYHGHYCQIAALSNSTSLDNRSNLVQKITDAMDEAIEQDKAILFPDNNSKLIYRAHQELARKFGSGSICTVPLVYEGKKFGAITLLRSEEKPFDQQTRQLFEQTFALLTPFLALRRETEKSLPLKVITSSKKTLQKLFGVRHLKLKLAVTLATLLIVVASMLEGDFKVAANTVLEGKIQRVVAAPFTGYLLSAAVRAGDTVEEGEVMASLNDAEIQLEMTRLKGELQKARNEYREAQSSRDLVKVSVVKEQVNQINAEIDLARQQLSRINLTAPFDGVVIEGDLADSLGAPVERGEPLFKIAPLEGYRIILKVDESDISHIQKGQSGNMILSSLSDKTFPLTIEKITVAAKAENGANVFRVEASLKDATDLLRPGMQGVGKIYIKQERLIWIWTREITDWLRLWLWSWLP